MGKSNYLSMEKTVLVEEQSSNFHYNVFKNISHPTGADDPYFSNLIAVSNRQIGIRTW